MTNGNSRPFGTIEWSAVFCSSNSEAIMSYIMLKVAESVLKIPEMYHNGSWKIEQFQYTDPDIYQFIDS